MTEIVIPGRKGTKAEKEAQYRALADVVELDVDNSPEALPSLLAYDPLTGHLYWKPRPREMFRREQDFLGWNRRRAGERAGSVNRVSGYVFVRVLGRLCYAHRLIWTMAHGPIPERLEIDHIDRDRQNNRLENLRLSTRAQNSYNGAGGRTIPTTSDYRGVSFRADTGRWTAGIGVNNRRRRLGCFDSETEAARAYDEAAKTYHGEFATLNFPEVA